jgi:hypothetical protein
MADLAAQDEQGEVVAKFAIAGEILGSFDDLID